MSTWDTEKEEMSLDYQVKAHLVLEDSDRETWGLARFIKGTFFELGQGEVVGTWSKAAFDGRYHISLETSIMALVDKATQLHDDLVRKRREGVQRAPSRRATPTPGVSSAPFDELRKSLKGEG